MSLHPSSPICRALIPHGVDDENTGIHRARIPESYPSDSLGSLPSAMDRSPSEGSTLTNASMHDSLFSKLSEAESSITEPAQTSTEALASGVYSKGGSADALPDILFGPASDPARELKHPTGTTITPS